MTRERRQFNPTDHLASEAVAAYVDGELRMNAYLRAAHHVSQCPDCASEVDAQQQARIALRSSEQVTMPSSLMGLLHQIPDRHPCAPGDSRPGALPSFRGGIASGLSGRFRRR